MDPRWQGNPLAAFGPDWEAGVPRVTDHEPNRVNKLKALGNAIIPQLAYVILAAIIAADEEGTGGQVAIDSAFQRRIGLGG